MHGGIELEFIRAAPVFIILVQRTVTAKEGDMFPRLKINQTNQIPG
jgi:hypothetical protein